MSQEYWDACLIRSWHNDSRILDAINAWESLAKANFTNAELKRKPEGFPYKLRTRIFIGDFFPKISDMLWDGKNNLEVFHQLKKYDKEQRIANQVNKEIINTRRNAAKIQSIGLTLAFNAVANQIKTPKTKRARKL
jgi:hypothetical protein